MNGQLKTHFALWRHGLMLTATAQDFSTALEELERRNGPAWLKGIRRVPGTYEPLP